MAIIARNPGHRPPRHRLSDELRLDVLGHQALAGLEWATAASLDSDELLDRIGALLNGS